MEFEIITKINKVIINPIIQLLAVASLVAFLWGVFQYVRNSDSSSEREKGQQHMLWGIVGLFIIFSVFGIVRFVCNSVGQSC